MTRTLADTARSAERNQFRPLRSRRLVTRSAEDIAGYGWGAWLPPSTWREIAPLLGHVDPAYVEETLLDYEGDDPVGIHMDCGGCLRDVRRALGIVDRRRIRALARRRA